MAELGWFYKEAPWRMENMVLDEILEWLTETRKFSKKLGPVRA